MTDMRYESARKISFALALAAIWLFAPRAAVAQSDKFPSRAVTLIVPFAPGGATDIVARLLGQYVSEDIGQSVVIDNRSGGAGNTGTLAAARSAPDGHTLVLATTTQLVNKFLMSNMAYDIFTDLVPVALVADAPELLAINAQIPAKTLAEFIAAARAEKSGFNYGSAGIGSVPHLGGEVLAKAIKAKMVHVPFRGSADAMKEVAAGNIHFTLATLASVSSFADAGLVRVIALAAPRRLTAKPEIPTTAESGLPNVELSNWFGIMAPKDTPAPIVARLNQSFNKASGLPDVRAKLAAQGIEPVRESPQYFANRLQEDAKSYRSLIDDIGLTPK